MLEINIPREVHRSPQAMEMIIDVLHHFGGGGMSWQHKFWYGAVLFPASLEIVSIEGSIYFFMRVHKQIADLVKSTMYSQYPNVEVNEVDDYTKYVPNYNNHSDTWDLYGVDFKLAKDDFIPIKTYIDYGLDKAVGSLEEYQKIDPMTPLLEFLTTLRAGEQIWLQIIVRADGLSDWRKRADKFIQGLMGRASTGTEDDGSQSVKLTHGEQEQIKSIQRSLSKHGFEAVIRALYIAKKENFRNSAIGFFKNPIFKPFASLYLNSIKKKGDSDPYDWVWQDITGKKVPNLKKKFFNDYINRKSFYGIEKKDKSDIMIFTSEELATLFHIPGRVSEATTLERVDATKAQPPQNLPI